MKVLAIESNRMLGGVGGCLILVGVVSEVVSLLQYAFPVTGLASAGLATVSGLTSVVALVGFLLVFISMYGFSKDYNEPRIFNYFLYALVIGIIAAVIITAVIIIIVLSNLSTFLPSFGSSSTPPSTSEITSSMLKSLNPIMPFFALVGLVLIFFVIRALNLLSDKSGVPMFRTAAKIFLAAAATEIAISIVLAIVGYFFSISYNDYLTVLSLGGIVSYVAFGLLASAFFRIRAPAT